MISQVVDIPIGTLTFNIDNAHLYDKHVEALKEQITRRTYDSPKLWINPEITNFYDFTLDDVKLIDYKHGDAIKLELSV